MPAAGSPATRSRPLTLLQHQLAEPPTPGRAGPLDAFRLARRKFLAAQRIDMSALAEEQGVNRVTLYRWVGSREQLLVEAAASARTALAELLERVVDAWPGDVDEIALVGHSMGGLVSRSAWAGPDACVTWSRSARPTWGRRSSRASTT